MKKYIIFATIVLCSAIVSFFYYSNQNHGLKESIIYFPIDPSSQFTSTSTNIKLQDQKDEDEYILDWNVSSILNRNAYLRQDISLLYEDGRLLDKMSEWKENTNELTLTKEISSEDTGHFEAISYHHAEIHYPNDIIKSAQKMSYDQLYVIDTPLQPLESFKEPTTKEELSEKKVLDHATNQQLHMVWRHLINYYQIKIEDYEQVPLTKLYLYNEKPLPGLTMEETEKAIGGLWEGLYKNYFLGIKTSKGDVVSPIGSSVPLILIGKDKTHLIILFETKSGASAQLIQYLD